METCCPLPLVLGQHYKTQARSKCQQLIQVFGFDLSGDSENSSKVMGKWQKMLLEVCHCDSRSMSYDLPPPDTLDLQHLVMVFGSRLELGCPLSQGSLGQGKPRQKAQWDSDIAGWWVSYQKPMKLSLVACGPWQLRWDGRGQFKSCYRDRVCLSLHSYKVSEESSRPLGWFCQVIRS